MPSTERAQFIYPPDSVSDIALALKQVTGRELMKDNYPGMGERDRSPHTASVIIV